MRGGRGGSRDRDEPCVHVDAAERERRASSDHRSVGHSSPRVKQLRYTPQYHLNAQLLLDEGKAALDGRLRLAEVLLDQDRAQQLVHVLAGLHGVQLVLDHHVLVALRVQGRLLLDDLRHLGLNLAQLGDALGVARWWCQRGGDRGASCTTSTDRHPRHCCCDRLRGACAGELARSPPPPLASTTTFSTFAASSAHDRSRNTLPARFLHGSRVCL